ncbi:MAG: hypothetical protein WDM96_12910 [Lacunisphaera sp.]
MPRTYDSSEKAQGDHHGHGPRRKPPFSCNCSRPSGSTPATRRPTGARIITIIAPPGWEHDLEDATAPYIVKNPALCQTLPTVLAREHLVIDYALIPIRRLDDAALSRIRVGGSGRTPGGLAGTADPP